MLIHKCQSLTIQIQENSEMSSFAIKNPRRSEEYGRIWKYF